MKKLPDACILAVLWVADWAIVQGPTTISLKRDPLFC